MGASGPLGDNVGSIANPMRAVAPSCPASGPRPRPPAHSRSTVHVLVRPSVRAAGEPGGGVSAGPERLRPGSGTCPACPPQGKEGNMESPPQEYTAELLRHFADLRDGTHGGAISRSEERRVG